jgi:hypothetical protein
VLAELLPIKFLGSQKVQELRWRRLERRERYFALKATGAKLGMET